MNFILLMFRTIYLINVKLLCFSGEKCIFAGSFSGEKCKNTYLILGEKCIEQVLKN